jgi:hypothetical protein
MVRVTIDSACAICLLAAETNRLESYWDPQIQPEKYSFVDFAIAQGYSVLYYDRLGQGQSEMYVHCLNHTYYP